MRHTIIKIVSIPVAAAFFLFAGALTASAQEKNATLMFDPTTQAAKAGQALTVTVKMNSGTEMVNAVQANISYPQDTLEFVGVDGAGSSFDIDAQKANENGVVKIARGVIKPVAGEHVVAKVNFKAKKDAASALLKVSNDSAIIRSTDNMNIMQGSTVVSKSADVYTNPDTMPTHSEKKSFWARIVGFFKGLFSR